MKLHVIKNASLIFNSNHEHSNKSFFIPLKNKGRKQNITMKHDLTIVKALQLESKIIT